MGLTFVEPSTIQSMTKQANKEGAGATRPKTSQSVTDSGRVPDFFVRMCQRKTKTFRASTGRLHTLAHSKTYSPRNDWPQLPSAVFNAIPEMKLSSYYKFFADFAVRISHFFQCFNRVLSE